MGEPIKILEIARIECRGLRSADFWGKNDVYVVAKVNGHTKKAKSECVGGVRHGVPGGERERIVGRGGRRAWTK